MLVPRPIYAPRLDRPPFVATAAQGPYRLAVQSQSVRGTIGTVVDLQAQVATAMEQRRLSWTALARKVGCSRQYLRKAIARPEVPADILESLTRLLDLQPVIRISSLLAPYFVAQHHETDHAQSPPTSF
jgi:hypothetical protein